MKIIKADETLLPVIQEFIIPYEYSCVLLASYIRKKSVNLYIISKDDGDRPLQSLKSNNLFGVFYCEKTLLHCIPVIDGFENELTQLFNQFFNNENTIIKCIDGTKAGTDLFLNILQNENNQAFQINHYRLMTIDHINSAPENLSDDDEVHRCTYEDMESIIEIQKAYITAEVAPLGKKVSDTEVALGLRQILKNQLCLAIFADDKAVCKANTNAIGFNWVQLGGVYTHPQFRRNYYAWHLISAICRRVTKSGKKTALFVKDINVPAITLYKKIGFVDAGLFEIAYF